jgi:hypothetical protein
MHLFIEEMKKGKIKASDEKFGVHQEEMKTQIGGLTSPRTPIMKGQWPVKKS